MKKQKKSHKHDLFGTTGSGRADKADARPMEMNPLSNVCGKYGGHDIFVGEREGRDVASLWHIIISENISENLRP